MKVERIGPLVYRIENTTDMEVLVIHGGEPQDRDVMKPGEVGEFGAPVEVRLGPFLGDPGAEHPKRIYINEAPSGKTSYRAMVRAWTWLERHTAGRDITMLDYAESMGVWMGAIAGLPDPNAPPPFKPAIVQPPKSTDEA